MDIISKYFKVQVPGYLKSLPIPSTAAGFTELTRDQWLQLIPFFLFLFVILYLLISPFLGMFTSSKQRRPRVNRRQKLSEKKVVDKLDMEDLDKLLKKNDGKVCYCRCWKSAKFPYCDGTHGTHNKETGDNVGPLVINNKSTKKKD